MMALSVKIDFPTERPCYDGSAADNYKVGVWHAFQDVANNNKRHDIYQIANFASKDYANGYKAGKQSAQRQRAEKLQLLRIPISNGPQNVTKFYDK